MSFSAGSESKSPRPSAITALTPCVVRALMIRAYGRPDSNW
jgi:hypothetical protein